MRLFNRTLIALAFLSASSIASAANQDLGPISTGSLKSFASITLAASSFLDQINFSLTAPGDASAGVGALNYTVGGMSVLGIDNLSLSLFDSSNSKIATGLDFTVFSLAPGDYHLEVSGKTTGIQGGIYAGSIRVSPVPEPSMVGMCLTGLLVLGFVTHRRREQE